MNTKFVRALVAAAAMGVAGSSALASLTTFYTANSGTATDFTPIPSIDAAVQTTITNFQSGLVRQSTFELEGLAPGDSPTGHTRSFSLSGAARFCGSTYEGEGCPSDTQFFPGRFNTTTGLVHDDIGNWIESTSRQTRTGPLQDTTTFTLSFDSVINAFGFFGTDFFDFEGVVTYQLFDAGDASVGSGSIAAGGSLQTNGSLLFFGVRSTTAFTKVTFTIDQTSSDTQSYDFIGLDSILVGEIESGPPTGTPEPATLALVGLGLLGAGAASRRRRVKA